MRQLFCFYLAMLFACGVYAQVCFKPSTYKTFAYNNPNNNQYPVISADMNKDGIKDLIVGDNVALVILAGKINGTLASPIYDSIPQTFLNLASADFNNDGYEDVVGTTYNSMIKIIFGDSALTHVDSTITPINGKGFVNVGDFNKDGNMDFITNDYYGWITTKSNLFTIFTGNGHGSFISSDFTVGDSTTNILNFCTADFNNDGYTDIAAYEGSYVMMGGINQPPTLEILMNNAAGSFTSTLYLLPTIGKLEIGDLNNDGFVDMLAIAPDSIINPSVYGLETFMNTGAGFTSSFFPLNEILGMSPTLADFDGDGFLDIATRSTTINSETVARIAFNNGSGGFSNVKMYYTDFQSLPGGGGGGPFVSIDVNMDSIPDLAMINYSATNNAAVKLGSRSISNTISSFANLSCANSSDGSVYFHASGSGAPFSYLWNTGFTVDSIAQLPASMYMCTVTASDGCKASYIKELTQPPPIYLNAYNTNLSCLGTSNNLNEIALAGGGTPPFQYNFDNSNWTSNNQVNNLSVGFHSVVVRDSTNCKDSLSFNLSIPPGLLPTQEYFSKHKFILGSVCADFNNDGFKDVATIYSDSNKVFVYLNNAGTGFSPALKYKFASGVPFSGGAEMYVADVNGDNNLDLFIVTNKIYLCNGTGLGGFISTNIIFPTSGNICVGDFDNDLKTDFVIRSLGSQQIRFYKGDGLGAFSLSNTVNVSQLSGNGAYMVSFDVNNDGNLDLLISSTKFLVLNGNGSGGFAAPAIYLSTTGSAAPIVKDINYDGYQDVIISGSSVQFYLGNVFGTYTLNKTITSSNFFSSVAIGDVNNDNVMDVVSATYNGIEINIVGPQLNSPTLINEPYSVSSLFLEDYNHDGNLDIIEQLRDSIYLKIYQNCLPLGVTNIAKSQDLTIYPNPAESIVNIALPESGNEKSWVRVYDINGRILIEQKFSESIALAIDFLSTGFYTVVVGNSTHTYRSKLIKNM